MSEPSTATVTKQELLDAGAALDPPATATAIRLWTRSGLLPRAQSQDHVVGYRGSVSRYPAYAIPLLAEVVRRHRDVHRLTPLLIGMFADGWPVDTAASREALCAVLQPISDEVCAVIAEAQDLGDAAELLSQSQSGRHRSAPARLLARRVGSTRELREFMYLLSLLGLGADPGWDTAAEDEARSPAQTFDIAFGLDRARRDAAGEPWFGEGMDAKEIAQHLARLGGLNLRDLAAPIRATTDRQLEEARDWARMLAADAPVQGQAIEALRGPDWGGAGTLSALHERDALAQAIQIRNMVLLLPTIPQEDRPRIAEQLRSTAVQARLVVAMREALPQYSDLLDEKITDRIASMDEAAREAFYQDVRAALQDHPTLQAQLDAADALPADDAAPN